MRILLAAAALVATLPMAHAQDKGKSDFTINGEFRVRDSFIQNVMGNADSKSLFGVSTHNNVIDQRFKVGLKFKPSEKYSVHATLLQAASWGQTNGEVLGQRGSLAATGTFPYNATENGNVMSVNEAYANWMMMDNLNAKFGRMNFEFGDGSIMSINDHNTQPYSFDGMSLNYELEFGKFNFFAFKYRDFNDPAFPMTINTTASDPSHQAYGLVFDLKTMPEILKAINVHVIQDVGDGIWAATANQNTVGGTQNQNTLRYGVMGKMAVAGFDFKANAEMVTGKYSDLSATGVLGTERSVNMSMYQAEVGYTLAGFMNSRFALKYHVDSGTSAADVAAGDKANTYDPYFYDMFNSNGAQQLVGWGNATTLSAHWTMQPGDRTWAGLSYWMHSKTDGEGASNPGYYGRALFAFNTASTDSSKDVGNEINVWAAHHYDANFSMLVGVGHFMPGGSLKEVATNNRPDAVTSALLQGKLTF